MTTKKDYKEDIDRATSVFETIKKGGPIRPTPDPIVGDEPCYFSPITGNYIVIFF